MGKTQVTISGLSFSGLDPQAGVAIISLSSFLDKNGIANTMNLPELIAHIDQLKKDADALQPLKPGDEHRLWKKLRLEWNYNSNHIEGNTLTYGETELLLIFDKTTGDHNKREYDEMQAHDVAIKMVQDLAGDAERPLTESFIRKLNETILVKPFWKEAETPDGQQRAEKYELANTSLFPTLYGCKTAKYLITQHPRKRQP